MYIIVGLGNPGTRYMNTRHNIGFLAIDWFANQHKAIFAQSKKYQAETTLTRVDNAQIMLVKPMTNMNLSGDSLRALQHQHDIQLGQLAVIHDDLDIAFGSYKISFDKNPAGHHGIESIIASIGTRAFWRLRFGIANDHLKELRKIQNLDERHKKIERFVVTPFDKIEQSQLPHIIESAFRELLSQIV